MSSDGGAEDIDPSLLRESGRASAMADLLKASNEMVDHSKAVEKLTKEALISDNRIFRRRNRVLMTGLALLLFSSALGQYRSFKVTQPQNRRIEEVVTLLQECTTPGTKGDPHECFADSQRRTAAAVQQVIDTDSNGVPDTQDLIRLVCQSPTLSNTPTCVEVTKEAQ